MGNIFGKCTVPHLPKGSCFNQLPHPFCEKVDAAVCVSSKKAYLFSGNLVVEYNVTKDNKGKRVLKDPVLVKEHPVFNQLPKPFNTKIDAAFGVNEHHCCFFSGDLVLDYNPNKYLEGGTRIIHTPRKIKDHPVFNQLPWPFDCGVDAALQEKEKCTLFFKEDKVLEYNTWSMDANNRVIKEPVKMIHHPAFVQLPPPFCMKIDAAFRVNDRRSYIFSGSHVLGYDTKETADGNRCLDYEALSGSSENQEALAGRVSIDR